MKGKQNGKGDKRLASCKTISDAAGENCEKKKQDNKEMWRGGRICGERKIRGREGERKKGKRGR